MMMSPDPNRQWFVYFNEKELGPFMESEVLRKIAAGDFTESAYVYTEGMSDWTLVSDIPVLQNKGPSVGQAPKSDASHIEDESTQAKVMSNEADNPFADLLGSDDVQASKVQSSKNSSMELPEAALSLENPDEGTKDDFAIEANTQVSHSGVTVADTKQQPKKQNESSVHSSSKNNASKNTKSSSTLSRPLATQSGVKTSAEPTQKANLFAANANPEVAKGDPKRKRILILVLVLLLVGAGALFTMQDGGISIPFLSEEEVPTTPEVPVVENTPVVDASPNVVKAPPVPPPQNVLSDEDWKNFFAFRSSQDTKGPPYSLAPRPMGDKFPVVLGILSPLIKDEKVFAAIFPDAERSLHAIPKIWYLEARTIDGTFSLGPLNLQGKEIPAGRYKVLVQTSSAYLGDTSFDLGTWPDEAKLKELRAATDAETKNLATQEREAFGLKMKEMKAALMQLESKSMNAIKGKKAAKIWKEFSKPWYESLMNAYKEQQGVTQGPMFYPDLQSKLLAYMDSIRNLEESYELVSQGGPKLLAKAKKKPIALQRSELARLETALNGDLANSEKLPIQILSVSLENVRKGLEYFISNTAQAASN